jgi:poly(3-hydroxyalkanoate) synthetase
VVRNITGAEKVNLLGLCLGGTLTMATLAYLDAVGLIDQLGDILEHLDRLQRAGPVASSL